MDIGSAVGRASGVTDEQLAALPDYATSDAFDETDRAVVEYATRMCQTPVAVPDELYAKLRARFDDAQLVELTAAIAWENYRARFNRALHIPSDGFSEGSVCALPA